MRVFLGAFGDAGHAFPMLALGTRLVERGHEVCLQTWRAWEGEATAAGMEFVAAPEYKVFPTKGEALRPYEAAVRATQETVPAVRDFAPDVAVADILTLAPAWAAELCSVPVATLIPHVAPDSPPGFPPYSMGARLPRTRLGSAAWRAVSPVVRRGLERGRDDCNDARGRLGLPPLPYVHTGLSRSLTLVGTLPQLEYPREWPSWMRVVGPLMWEPPGDLVEPPQGDGPVILVAPSTAHDDEHHMLLAALRGLGSERVRVIATFNGREPPWLATEPVPANAKLVPWISYAKSMPACDLVVTHGGHGTLVRALTSGCAVVVCPAAGDMFENAARSDWTGAGVRLPRRFLTPAGLRLAVRRALRDRSIRARAREIAAWAADHDGPSAAVDEIERWAAAAVTIADPDPGWAAAFDAEAARIRDALGDLAVRIDHVGSTSVPGLAAKPIIDVQLSVPSLDVPLLSERLAGLGYVHVPVDDPGTEDYPFFALPAEHPRTHHLHACVAGGDQEHRHLAVRDYLRARPDEAAAYAAVKREAAARSNGDRNAYMDAKDAFVKALEARALAWAARTPAQ
jgi:UDP:flavonoid glycosyltransferase YjiC (YdhE family)/GrpB-like predicted nucleotidyltransferase (UPF0157 family)